MQPLEAAERRRQRRQLIAVGAQLLEAPEVADRCRQLRQPVVADVQVAQADQPREQRLAQRGQLVVVQIEVVGQARSAGRATPADRSAGCGRDPACEGWSARRCRRATRSRPLSARISVSSAVWSHTDAGTVPSCCFHRFSDFASTVAGQRLPQVSEVKSSFRGGADMKRSRALGILLAAGAASMAAQTPAPRRR